MKDFIPRAVGPAGTAAGLDAVSDGLADGPGAATPAVGPRWERAANSATTSTSDSPRPTSNRVAGSRESRPGTAAGGSAYDAAASPTLPSSRVDVVSSVRPASAGPATA